MVVAKGTLLDLLGMSPESRTILGQTTRLVGIILSSDLRQGCQREWRKLIPTAMMTNRVTVDTLIVMEPEATLMAVIVHSFISSCTSCSLASASSLVQIFAMQRKSLLTGRLLTPSAARVD